MSEKLNKPEFLLLLEKEVVQYAISIFLFSDKFKDKYSDKILSHYAKIVDISSKLGVDNIFNSNEVMKARFEEIVPKFGSLNFTYRGDNSMEEIINASLYQVGTELTCNDGKDYKVLGYIHDSRTLLVKPIDEENPETRKPEDFNTGIQFHVIYIIINNIISKIKKG